MRPAAFFGMTRRVARASSTRSPRTMFAIARIWRGDIEIVRTNALACMVRLRLLLVAAVTVVGPGRGELAELVADHVLGHEHGLERLAVVHGERQADHVR